MGRSSLQFLLNPSCELHSFDRRRASLLASLALLVLASVGPGASVSLASQPSARNGGHGSVPQRSADAGGSEASTLWLIPHTHWEGAVFKTREEYLEEGLPHILQALYLLRTFPDYRFVLDQVAYIKPFLERYPEEAGEFRRFVASGRLQITGGNDVMLDVNIPSGESWIRQVLYAKGYCRRELGIDVTTGWGLDTFGHHAQMPQLLKLAGFDSYWFQRGVHGDETPSEFLWKGLDGTTIPAFWLPFGYGLFYPVARSPFEFEEYARGQWDALGRHSRFNDRVALAGADVISPEAELPERVKAFNAQASRPFTIRFGVPSDFEAVVSKRTGQPVIGGELNPVFQGIYSSRIELKQRMREDERLLTTAEKLSALAEWLGVGRPDDDRRWVAWEPVLFNQAHDLTSGTMVDKVYLDTMRGYDFAKELGSHMVEETLAAIGARIDTRASDPAAVPILVFNPLGWPRTDIVQADIGFSQPGVTALGLEGPEGRSEPLQIVEAGRYPDGGLRSATIAFIARDVPAIGWSVYHVVPEHAGRVTGAAPGVQGRTGGAGSSSTMHVDSGSIENESYRASFDLWTGAMTALELKSPQGDWEVLGGRPANVVAEEQDGGDFWELYGNLNGGRLTAMTRTQGLPDPQRSHLSTEWVGGSGSTEAGPVFSEFHIDHPFGNGSFSTRVRVYRGISRIDVETRLVNNDRFVRYRLILPTAVKNGRRFDEIPFGAIERPESQEFPAQNWIDYGDDRHGVALLNVGLPGSNVAEGALIASLMRSARISAYPFFGGYEPGVSSDLGLELGQERTFHYALVPHQGRWQEATVFRAGLDFNRPLIARPLGTHPGALPAKWGLVEITPADVVLSSVAPSEDGEGIIARVYEAAGQPVAGAKIRFQPEAVSAQEVNLMERPGASAAVNGNSISFDLRPFEIKTFEIKYRPLLK